MLTEEVCTNDRLADIGQDESPIKGFPEAKVERQSMFAKGGDYRAVCGPERESFLPYLMNSMCCRKHADFSTGFDQVALARGVVSDEKKATIISRFTGHHQWAGKAFSNREQGFFWAFGSIFTKLGMIPAEFWGSRSCWRR